MGIAAGVAIAIACIINAAFGGGPLGAVFFGCGLIMVMQCEMKLFTGQAGKLATGEIGFFELLGILIANVFATFLIGLLINFVQRHGGVNVEVFDKVVEVARGVVKTRVEASATENLVLGIFCGILMYAAVNCKHIIGTVMLVAAFVASGFAHCIADSFYYVLAGNFKEVIWPFLTVVLGNFLGCLFIPMMGMYIEIEEIEIKE